MKKITAILLTAVFIMTFFTGCGKKRELYNNVNLKNYVEVGEYLGIEIDTESDEFAEYYTEIFNLDIEDYDLYKTTKDVVESGDTVTIDYVGKLDGVAFEGGTATGADLEIGSGTFIDDFEEELIGVAVGETKNVTATFPTPYQNNPDLAGKEAIFTVKVNYINKVNMTEEEAYSKMDFDSVEDYIEDITKRAVQQYILDTVCDDAKIKDYPSNDSEKLCEAIYEFYVDAYKATYNVNLEDLLIANGSSIEQYKSDLSTQMVPPMMNVNMVMYYILDTENLEIYESTVESQDVDQPVIAESYAVQEIVIEYLYDNAKIK